MDDDRERSKTSGDSAAGRALAEAQARRTRYLEHEKRRKKEIGGRKGLDPARYGDWEKNGIASDF